MVAYSFVNGQYTYTGSPFDDQFFLSAANGSLTVFASSGADYIRSGSYNDYIYGSEGTDYIYAGQGQDIVFGDGGNDILSGDTDNGTGIIVTDFQRDTIYGGLGNDYLRLTYNDIGYGNAGDDTYDLKDFYGAVPLINENANEGIDTVGITGSSNQPVNWYYMQANFENLNLGEYSFNGVGNDSDNIIIGNTLSNIIYGNQGNDTLSGGDGQDALYGGDGNDTIFGGSDNDILVGNDGRDILVGDGGADSMTGGLGDDLYSVDNVGDTVIEDANSGYDEVYSTINFILPENTETLFLIGSAVSGTGNSANNAIIGNELDNILDAGAGTFEFINGGGGNDVIIGGAGHDEMMGGAGADKFFYRSASEGSDFIYDFTPGIDKFDISSSGFQVNSIVDGINFINGSAPTATTSGPTFLYNNQFGYLFYDVDGIGSQSPTVIALLNGVPNITASDFLIH